MRITDLTRHTLMELSRPDLQTAIDRLQQAGWTKGGSGFFSMVFVNPKQPYVLKLFSATDAPYMWFLDFSMQHPSPFLPEIRGKLTKITDYYYGVRLRRYRALSQQDEDTIMDMIVMVTQKNMNLEQIKQRIENFRTGGYVSDEEGQTYARTMYDLIKNGFYQTLVALAKEVTSKGYQFDFRGDNIMMGANGQPVIIDPVRDQDAINAHAATKTKPVNDANYLLTKPGRNGPVSARPKQQVAAEAVRPKFVHQLMHQQEPPRQDKIRFIADQIERGYDWYLNRVRQPTPEMKVVYEDGQLRVWLAAQWLRDSDDMSDPGPNPQCMVRVGVEEAMARFEERFVDQVRQEIIRAFAEVGWRVEITDTMTKFVHPDQAPVRLP